MRPAGPEARPINTVIQRCMLRLRMSKNQVTAMLSNAPGQTIAHTLQSPSSQFRNLGKTTAGAH
jgi:hypothetical protein